MRNERMSTGDSIEVLGFPTYIKTRLARQGLTTIDELRKADERTLRFGSGLNRGLGNKSIQRIKEALEATELPAQPKLKGF